MAFDVALVVGWTLLACGLLYGAVRAVTALSHAFPRATSFALSAVTLVCVIGLVVGLIVIVILALHEWYGDAIADARSYVDD
jgi:uncharacterized membrane protein